MTKLIIADKWLEKLCESQGINYRNTNRIIIDAKAGGPVLMYITQFGDSGLLEEVTPPEVIPPDVTAKS